MRWRDKYNEFRDCHGWQQYETRDKIDDVLVKNLSELLEELEAEIEIERLQNKSHNSNYVTELNEILSIWLGDDGDTDVLKDNISKDIQRLNASHFA